VDWYQAFLSIWPVWLIIVEIIILLGLYRFYIANLNAEKWEQRAREDGWLVEILQPVILETTEMVSATVLEALERKYRQSMGVLSRVSKSGTETEAEVGLSLAESVLQSMGYKQPHIMLVSRLAGSLSGLLAGAEQDPSPELSAKADLATPTDEFY